MKRTSAIYLLAALAATAGCNTSGCLDNQSALPLAGFYSSSGSEISVRGLRISGVGAPNDSVVNDTAAAISTVYLPMRSTTDNTAWCIHYKQEGIDDPAYNDTISFGYTSEPYFASEECGAMYYYRINSVRTTTHLIDSVVVTDSLITNVDVTRIRIYLRTSDNPDAAQ